MTVPHETLPQEITVDGNLHEKSPPLLSDSAATHEPQVKDEPPNGGYGWVCVFCVFLINAHTWGVNSSYGIFLAHYISNQTFGPGELEVHS